MKSIDHFQILNSQLSRFSELGRRPGPIGFLGQEALRFHSIAGTLKESRMVDNSSDDKRFISHILARSLIESFFWIVYIFDNTALRDSRYRELIISFKREYLKFYRENLPINSSLVTPDPSWGQLQGGINVRSMIDQVRNDQGQKLDPLYSIYRILSFDTHGKSLNNIITSALGGAIPNFPALDLESVFDLIANQYLCTLGELTAAGEV
jgi:hypothetical protein